MNTTAALSTSIVHALNGVEEAIAVMKNDSALVETIASAASRMTECIRRGGKIMTCGNGGFAAISQHIVAELMGKLRVRRNPLPALSLVSDTSLLTCIANDFGYEKLFSRQLRGLGRRGDIVLLFTTSGRSKNILEAASMARESGIEAIAFTGRNAGGQLEELDATVISVPADRNNVIQDIVMMIFHQICASIEASMADDAESADVWNRVKLLGRTDVADTLLLDRDGVVNRLIPNDYALSVEDIELNPEFLAEARNIAELFPRIFIVTNQACIGKGRLSAADAERINRFIVDTVAASGGRIDRVYTCPDADKDSPMRKPSTGMADLISADYPEVDYSRAVMVGDSYSDRLFAERLGSRFINIQNV